MPETSRFDALLLLSFGGPDGPEDVRPFLANVMRGRPVHPERLDQVTAHYLLFGGKSPINDENRAVLSALRAELDAHGRSDLPLYWGNRNWQPYLADTMVQMRCDGVRRAVVFVTSAYSSYSSCRQYLEDLERAREQVGPGAPEVEKIRPYFRHPGFVEPLAEGLAAALIRAPAGTPVLMTAHSIPEAMAATCAYTEQLAEVASRVATGAGAATRAGAPVPYQLVYQSRSGPPAQRWLGPDVLEAIAALPEGTPEVIVVPIGFVSDHMEVVYDLDTQAAEAAGARGIHLVRTPTPGTHPKFVAMIRDLVEQMEASPPGTGPASAGRPTSCPPGCCPPAHRPIIGATRRADQTDRA